MHSNRKIVFFGTPDFAVASLDALVKSGHEIAAVVTATDKPAGRGHGLLQSAVKKYALAAGIPVLQPERLRDPEFLQQLRHIDAALFVVIAFRMLPEAVWGMPPCGTFNLHASLLPRYRGAAPINWAVINGDTATGVTTFFLSHEIDTGDVIDRREVQIHPDDNVGDVHDRLMALGAELTVDTVDRIFGPGVTPVPQAHLAGDEQPTPAPKIFKDTCHIRWDLPAERVHNLVRGLSPYPGAWSTLTSAVTAPADVKIFATALTALPAEGAPGTVHTRDGRLLVDCADCALEICALQAPGKKRMATADWLRGSRLADDAAFA